MENYVFTGAEAVQDLSLSLDSMPDLDGALACLAFFDKEDAPASASRASRNLGGRYSGWTLRWGWSGASGMLRDCRHPARGLSMEIQSLLADKRAKIDVRRSPGANPTLKSLFLHAL
jgi:hypothetical protein